jgi:hypothetical protein
MGLVRTKNPEGKKLISVQVIGSDGTRCDAQRFERDALAGVVENRQSYIE